MARALAATYDRRVSAFRPQPGGGETAVCQGAACALSRTAHLSAPQPPPLSAPLPESRYALTLYTPPELAFQLGDRLEISDGADTVHALASDSFRYPSHCVTVVSIGQVSRETGEGDA